MNTGIYTMSEKEYHSDPCDISLSSHIAKLLLTRSPYHAYLAHPKLNPNYSPDFDDKFDLGTAAHALLLEGKSDGLVIVEADDWRTKAAKEQRDNAHAQGKTALLLKHYAKVEHMVSAANKFLDNSELSGIFSYGKTEQTVIWDDDDIQCRARLDYISDDRKIIIDYKTTDCAEPEAFIRRIASLGYDIQASFYDRGIQQVSGEKPSFVFLAQETEYPYLCSLVGLSEEYLQIAEAKVSKAIAIWRDCLLNKKWPAYPNRVCYAEPNSWQRAEYERILSEGGQ